MKTLTSGPAQGSPGAAIGRRASVSQSVRLSVGPWTASLAALRRARGGDSSAGIARPRARSGRAAGVGREGVKGGEVEGR